MTTPYSDLSGIFHVQQQYLVDLSALSANNATTAITGMDNLRTRLTSAYTTYSTAFPATNAILSNQTEMYNIINKENERLAAKKNSVDSALYGQKRMAQFSDSYSKKYFAQIKVLIVIIIVVLIYLGLNFLNNFIPVPDAIFLTIMIIVGLFGFFVVVFTLKDIVGRYNMDFDKINFTAPSRSSLLSGNITGNVFLENGGIVCFGESCCPPGNNNGTFWDSTDQQCKFDATKYEIKSQGFTLMSEAYPIQRLNINGLVKPYEPSEINSYSKL